MGAFVLYDNIILFFPSLTSTGTPTTDKPHFWQPLDKSFPRSCGANPKLPVGHSATSLKLLYKSGQI